MYCARIVTCGSLEFCPEPLVAVVGSWSAIVLMSLQRYDEMEAAQPAARLPERLAVANLGRNGGLMRSVVLESLRVRHYVGVSFRIGPQVGRYRHPRLGCLVRRASPLQRARRAHRP